LNKKYRVNEFLHTTRSEEIGEQLVQLLRIYTNGKGRYLKDVKFEGIDKTSDNFKPWSISKHNGANYTIKVVKNTFVLEVHHIIGTGAQPKMLVACILLQLSPTFRREGLGNVFLKLVFNRVSDEQRERYDYNI
jgi:hypothetical protein